MQESGREALSVSKFLRSSVSWAGAHMHFCLPVMSFHHNRLESTWGFRIWWFILSRHLSITPTPVATPACMGTMQQRTESVKLYRQYFMNWARLYYVEMHLHLNIQLSAFITTEKTHTLQLKHKNPPFQSNRPHWWIMPSTSCTAEDKWARLPRGYLIQLSKGC